MTKLIIESTDNGYILSGKFENSDAISKIVIQDNAESDSDLDTMSALLHEVKEYFGIYYSKHNEKNLMIKIE